MTLDEKLERLTDGLTELKGAMAVEAELLSRHERQAHARFAEHEEWLKQLDRRLDPMVTVAESREDQMAEFRSSVARLVDLLDRLIRGQQGNGHSAV